MLKPEQKQLLGFLGRLLVLAIFCSLYAIGGSGDFWGGQKWIRRFLDPALLCSWGFIISRDWRSFVFMPLMMGALTLPYGADSLAMKILLRALDGVACGITFNLYNFLNENKSLAGTCGVFLAVAGSIVFGAFNPWPNAIIEQGLIALCFSLTYIFNVNRKNGAT